MKKLALISLFLLSFSAIFACEIVLEVENGIKEKYAIGEEIVIKVKFTFTHRVCNVSLEDTKFEGKGLEILGGTDWKESSFNSWERKIKVKVTGSTDGNCVFNVIRTCDKVGGFATVSFKAKPVKAKKNLKTK